MRVREQFYSGSELERVQAEIRKARRAEKMWTASAVVVLIVLAALVYWLAGLCVHDLSAAPLMRTGVSALPSMPLAMAPVMQGSIMGLVAFLIVGLALMAARKIAETEKTRRPGDGETLRQRREFWENGEWPHDVPAWTVGPLECLSERRITELVDPFAECTDGLTGDEMHRILTSCAAEAREIKRLVMKCAAMDANDEELEDTLAASSLRLSVLIRCVESLCERLEPRIDEDETVIFNQGGRP